jgi:hypothetical protein
VPDTVNYTVTLCSYRTENVTQPVTRLVCDTEAQQVQYTVPTCTYRTEQRTYESHQTVCEYHQETVTGKQCYPVTVPYQYTVKVPVYMPVYSSGCGGTVAPVGGMGCCY